MAPPEVEQPGSIMELLRLAAEIRAKLGGQGYLIENYLSFVFKAITATSGQDAVTTGFDEASRLQDLCCHALNARLGGKPQRIPFRITKENPELEKHPFYPEVIRNFAEHPDTLQSQYSVVNRHYVLLSDVFLQHALSRFLEEEQEEICGAFDRVKFRGLYDEISAIVGEPYMERLNLMLKKQFLAVPVSSGFTYGFACVLLYNLIYMDDATGKQIFQLLLDGCSDGRQE